MIQEFSVFFYGILSVLALMLVLCLIRAVKGPRIADRLIAVNMIGTMVMVMIGTKQVLIKMLVMQQDFLATMPSWTTVCWVGALMRPSLLAVQRTLRSSIR